MYFKYTSIQNIFVSFSLLDYDFIVLNKSFDKVKVRERVISKMVNIVLMVTFHYID